MAQNYVVPSIYQDISNQAQDYFAFRFSCPQCSSPVENSARFCPECGTKLQSAT